MEGEPDQVGAARTAGFGPDAVHPGVDGPDAEVKLPGDLGVGAALSDQGDQLPLPGIELAQVQGRRRLSVGVRTSA